VCEEWERRKEEAFRLGLIPGFGSLVIVSTTLWKPCALYPVVPVPASLAGIDRVAA